MKKTLVIAAVAAALGATAAWCGEAKELYEKECAKCHGSDGKGETKMGKRLGSKDYTDPKVQAGITDEAIYKSIKEGFKKDDKIVMKPAEGMSDKEIKAIVNYMRAFKK